MLRGSGETQSQSDLHHGIRGLLELGQQVAGGEDGAESRRMLSKFTEEQLGFGALAFQATGGFYSGDRTMKGRCQGAPSPLR